MSDERITQLEQQVLRLSADLEELRLSRAQKAIRTIRRNKRAFGGFIACMILLPVALQAFTYPNADFVAGNPAVAADVNARFTAIKTRFDDMEGKSWRLVFETTVVANTTSISATGLDGNVDKTYQIYARFVNASGANCNYYLQPNGDASATYGQQYVAGTGNLPSANTSTGVTGMHIANANSSQSAEMNAFMYAVTGAQRILQVNETNLISTGAIGNVQYISSSWNNSATNLTSMTIVASQTNGIGVGSHIEIWARR